MLSGCVHVSSVITYTHEYMKLTNETILGKKTSVKYTFIVHRQCQINSTCRLYTLWHSTIVLLIINSIVLN